MTDLTLETQERLLQAAVAARTRSHSPYSRYAVGAAILDETGAVHVGANIENAAYPQGWCAETTALGAMVMAGGQRAVAVLVIGSGPDVVTPCGGCRQKLREFGNDDMVVLAADPTGIRRAWTLGQLLPASFGPQHLA